RDEELHLRGTLPELTWDPEEPVIGLGCTVEGDEPVDLEMELAFDDPLGARFVRNQLSDSNQSYEPPWSPRTVSELVEALRAVLVVDPSPRAMRGYSHEQDRSLRSDAANVSAVLYQLCNDGRADDVLEFVRALPEQDISKVDFIETPR